MSIKSLKVSKYFKNNPLFPCINYVSINVSKYFSKLQNTYLWLFGFESFQNVQNNIIHLIIDFGKNILHKNSVFLLLWFCSIISKLLRFLLFNFSFTLHYYSHFHIISLIITYIYIYIYLHDKPQHTFRTHFVNLLPTGYGRQVCGYVYCSDVDSIKFTNWSSDV